MKTDINSVRVNISARIEMTRRTDMLPVIHSVVQRLITAYKPEKIFLFGSYAYGEPHEESDIDLLIVKRTKKRPIDRRIAVRKLVSGLRKKRSFSPVVVTPDELSSSLRLGNDFFKEITTKGRILYEKR